MFNLEAFTDRREALALFDLLRGRDPHQPWPLLPILTFLAPGGSGKSTLIEYLRVKHCSLPDGRAVLPYARLDFTLPNAPRDLLSILVNLRDQLQSHADGQSHHLTFPRFDLGALIALASASQDDPAAVAPNQVRAKLAGGKQVFAALATLGSSLGLTVPYVAPLLAGLALVGQIQPLRDILLLLENRVGWTWYRQHGTETGIPAGADIKAVIRRLHQMSRPGTPERETLLTQILPAAFVADMLDGLYGDAPKAWSATANVVLFLDGFEALLADAVARTDAMRLLEMLARPAVQPTPLLLVVGCRDRQFVMGAIPDPDQNPVFEQRTDEVSDQQVLERARQQIQHWQQRLPARMKAVELADLYVPLWLPDFGAQDTAHYLAALDRQDGTSLFADPGLITAIATVTGGHPLALALAAAVVQAARQHGRDIHPETIFAAAVPHMVASGREQESVERYLLDRFLSQLPPAEQRALILCAAPRFLDVRLIRMLLNLSSDADAHERWERYRRLTFMRIVDRQRIIFHPMVRALLLRRLMPSQEPESDYYQVHTRLREQFGATARRSGGNDEHARIEAAYHALALGNPEPAIQLGIQAQRTNPARWELVLEEVAQAPTSPEPFLPTIDQLAFQALEQAERQRTTEWAVRAIILYQWVLSGVQENPVKFARVQHNLGAAYSDLPGGDRQANLQRAIACYEAALAVRTREAFPVQWAMTQNNLGIAYRDLPGGDRQANLQRAIACYEAALAVRTREAFPVDWAMTQNNLGNAYSDLPGGDRQANLQRAIACYEAALAVRTREAFPVDWAMTQNNLGAAYSDLPEGDRQANLQRAIACYEAALAVSTREAFPVDWAMTQNNLGAAYSDLPGGDRQANLQRAIACYEAALEVSTREAFPVQWAMTQNNLGLAYSNLPGGDRQANLQRAIACYEAALEVSTREAFPVQWAMTQNNLGLAYSDLPGRDRQANLQRAIACYEAALEVSTREAFPVQWAMTQNNLGAAYQNLPGGDRQANLQRAIACYEAALEVRTREAFPVDWAMTQNNLGLAYRNLPGGDRQANLQRAIACYEAALEVSTREAFPVQWAMTQNNLGLAYQNLPGGDRQAKLERAIACFEAALEVFRLRKVDYYAQTVDGNLKNALNELDGLQ